MRIIRFLADDGHIHYGQDLGDGTATVLLDPLGVLGSASADQRDLFRGRRVLVADDDEYMRQMMVTVLERVGCACLACEDGSQAINIIEREPIDMIVSDIVMPHHDGYEVFSSARARHGDLPIVLVTGFGYDPGHALVRASKEGLAAVLYKPFSPQELLDELETAIRYAVAQPADALVVTDSRLEVLRLLAPLAPVNIICIGRNYRDAEAPIADESVDHLEVFMKPNTSVQSTGEAIRIPNLGGTDPLVDCEGELAVIIGRTAAQISSADAASYVLGYTAANDVTARHWQIKGGASPWMRGKGFDTFCPLGPAIVTSSELDTPNRLGIRTIVNGQTVRHGSTGDMIHPVEQMICELSRHITLEAGTVILTGAPPTTNMGSRRSSYLEAGDEVAVEIDTIGRLVNHVETG